MKKGYLMCMMRLARDCDSSITSLLAYRMWYLWKERKDEFGYATITDVELANIILIDRKTVPTHTKKLKEIRLIEDMQKLSKNQGTSYKFSQSSINFYFKT